MKFQIRTTSSFGNENGLLEVIRDLTCLTISEACREAAFLQSIFYSGRGCEESEVIIDGCLAAILSGSFPAQGRILPGVVLIPRIRVAAERVVEAFDKGVYAPVY